MIYHMHFDLQPISTPVLKYFQGNALDPATPSGAPLPLNTPSGTPSPTPDGGFSSASLLSFVPLFLPLHLFALTLTDRNTVRAFLLSLVLSTL